MKKLLLPLLLIFVLHLSQAQIVKDFDLPEFHSISLNTNYEVKIRQFNAQSVKVTVEQEILDQTEIKVEDGILYINPKEVQKGKQSVWAKIDKVKIDPEMTLEVSMVDIKSIEVNGKGKVVSVNTLNTDSLFISLNGAGQIDVDSKTKYTSAGIYSNGQLQLTGYCSDLSAEVFGGGNLYAPKYSSRVGNVILRGESEAEISVSENAFVWIYGPSTLKVGGNTKSLTKHIYGSGTVLRANLP